MAQSMLERIAKLLNQAENAGTPEEAEVFMAKAQEQATLHSIDLAKARHATVAKQRTRPVQRNIFIGGEKTRGLRTLTDLYLGIARANDIRCTIAHNATMVYAIGFPEDLDMSEALFASLQVQQAKALDVFKSAGEWRDEKVWSESKWRYVPITWLTARLNFQAAYAARIGHRLSLAKYEEQARIEREEAEAKARPHLNEDGALNDHFVEWFFDRHGLDLRGDDSTAVEFTEAFLKLRRFDAAGVCGVSMADEDEIEWAANLFMEYVEALRSSDDAGTALVLVEKQEALDEEFAPYRRAARGSYRGGTSGAQSASGRAAGVAAANKASLGRATALGGSRGAIRA